MSAPTLLIPQRMLDYSERLARLQAGSEEALAAARRVDDARALVALSKAKLSHAQGHLRDAEQALEDQLGIGQAVTTGEALYYCELGPDGNAEVNEAAVRAAADELGPLGLAPREQTVTKYPTVAAVRAAHKELRRAGFARGMRAFLIESPERPKIRRRSLGTGEVDG